MVPIGPGADEERPIAGRMVLGRQRLHMRFDQEFRAMCWQIQHKILESRLGDGAEQRVDIGRADDAEHLGTFAFRMGKVAHYWVISA
jgi:hypothetical protein